MKKTCEVCKVTLYKYECPKCEIVYCSKECYNKHNDSCVHEFLDTQVKQVMKSNELTELDKKEFEYKLKRFYAKNADTYLLSQHINDTGRYAPNSYDGEKRCKDKKYEDEIDEEIEEGEVESEGTSDDERNGENVKHLKKWCISKKRYKVLTELALKDKLDLEDLNETEKKQFFSFLKSKNLDEYFTDFKPWWLDCVIKKVPSSKHLCCNIKLNDNVVFIIIEILYSYCYFVRIRYGEIELQDFCYSLIYLACSLNRETLPPTDILSTINCLFQRIMENENFPQERELLYNIIIDVTKILSIKDLILRCLKECKSYFKKMIHSIKLVKEDNVKNSFKKEERLKEKSFFNYVYKKIKFLYSFTFYHYEKFDEVKNKLTLFYDSHKNFTKSNDKREIIFPK